MERRTNSRRKTAYRRDSHFISGKKPFVLALILLCVLAVCVFARAAHVRTIERNYIEQEAQLDQNIAAEESRQAELEAHEQFMKTDEFVEQVAEENLGLVHEDDIIFKGSKK